MTWILLLLMSAADLSSVKAEPNLEKRSELALSFADHQIDEARTAYQAGNVGKMNEALEGLLESANLAFDSLQATNKSARKSKWFKRAELHTRALSRRLMTLSGEVSVDDRKLVDDVHLRLQDIHDKLLEDIMTKK